MNTTVSPQIPVAIIGIGCIFAKSSDLKAYLHLLNRGINGVSDPPESHNYLADYLDPDPKKPDHIYCNRGGFLPRIDFDPTEFGIPPNALEATDTSQLLGLVTAKRALADAGYGDKGKGFDRSKASVILGVTGTQELVIPLGARLGHPFWQKALREAGVPEQQASEVIQRIRDEYVDWQENSFPGLLGNVVAGRIANRLDLGGTNCVVDAACASSMGAVHMALLELTSGRSDIVITGGVDTINDAFMHMCFSKTHILSASGDVRPFSEDADGTVLGEGVGIVVLKRLEDAERDGDRVYAVIKGIGSASDGKSQSIYAPRPEGQARALNRAYESAGIDPTSVGMVEAHGTGTRVGDQVEFKALCDVFGAVTPNGNRCALGSVKSNIGHTKAAAGTAGLIKTALAIYHKVLPPTLKAENVDPKLGMAHSPFYVNTHLRPWISDIGHKRRAGVSAFGFGGSNFHTVLEEHTSEKTEPSWDGSVELASFSAAQKSELIMQIEAWTQQIRQQPTRQNIGKLAKQLRMRFQAASSHRLVMVLDLTQSMDALLQTCRHTIEQLSHDTSDFQDGVFYASGAKPGKMVFLYPGQGSQYVGMGRDITCCFPKSLAAFQQAASFFEDELSLEEYVHPRLNSTDPSHESRLRQTQVAQPAIGAVSLAMHRALTHFEVFPSATCGHSFGELSALCAAGWISDETLWQLAIARGQLMSEAGSSAKDPGGMLAVKAPLDQIISMLDELDQSVVLANRNGHQQGVLSGPLEGIEAAEKACKTHGWQTVRLPVSAAFHSPLVADAQKPFAVKVSSATITPTETPVMSNTTGGSYPGQQDEIAKLLGGQLAHPVDFVGNLTSLYEKGYRTFVEVGPKSVLTHLVQQTFADTPVHAIAVDRSNGRRQGVLDLAYTLGQLASLGYTVNLNCWEKAMPAARKARMAISLSGANYRVPKPARKSTHGSTQRRQAHSASIPRSSQVPMTGGDSVSSQPVEIRTAPKEKTMVQPSTGSGQYHMDKKNKQSIQSAMETVQQGLASLQALQAQTTQAHQKYLETQAEASKALNQLIQRTQLFGDASLSRKEVAPEKYHSPIGTVDHTMPSTTVASEPPSAPADPEIAEPMVPAPPKEVTPAAQNALKQTLLGIVSELTGYPAEMLGLDMDIEADLGIDSIKRVEILSALEEKMPDLPKVTPDLMGSLKSLGQICDYLGAETAPSPAPVPQRDTNAATAGPVSGALQETLVGIVSELTGYPAEMLGLDMDIEADLGIDSIKRVEILSALEEKMPDLPKVTPDLMGTLKTLGQICDYLGAKSSPSPMPAPEPDAEAATAGTIQAPASARVDRMTLNTVSLSEFSIADHHWPANHIVAIVGADEQMGPALIAAFEEHGIAAKVLTHTEELMSEQKLCALMLMAPLSAPEAFQWAKTAAPLLQHAAGYGTAGLFSVSFLDGAFGLEGDDLQSPEQGALAGLIKTADLEWPNVLCRALDIDPHWKDVTALCVALAREVVYAEAVAEVEIGLGPDHRVGLQLTKEDLPSSDMRIALETTDVVVITGGGRGVTAAAAAALAQQTPCRLALLGRSPAPQPEPQWLEGVQGPEEIKKALIRNLFQGQHPTPVQVEAVYKQYAANREMQATLNRCEKMGVTARYFSVDVRNPSAVESSLDLIRKEMGPLKGLIHGAGVLRDRSIVDKQVSQFKQVYDTKVQGLKTLLKATQEDNLGYLVLFSSVSARMGNNGQVDYAMANETLNKMAQQQAHLRPNCKVISINWGPWDGGMVNPGLKKAFHDRGVALVPLEAGGQAMVAEMAQPQGGTVEVVIGACWDKDEEISDRPSVTGSLPEDMTMTCQREIDLNGYPVLRSHQINGRPVVPLALITEWLAHSALHANPGLSLHGIDQLRLLNGITMDQKKRRVHLLAGRAIRQGRHYEVDVEIRNGQADTSTMIHSSAKAILTEDLPDAPIFQENGHFQPTDNKHSLDEIYKHILFHGNDLRGMKEIIAISDHGMSARVSAAPPPATWIQEPLRSRWIADPLILDSAFQMAIVWCFDRYGQVSLPSYAAQYRQYCRSFPTEGVYAVMEVNNATHKKLICNFTFLNAEKQVLAVLSGYEAVMTPELMKAFKAA